MNEFQLYLAGWEGIIRNFWPVLIFIIVGLAVIDRRDKLEEKRKKRTRKYC